MSAKQTNTKLSKNRIFILMTLIYTVILLFISSVACLFAYRQKKSELLSQMDLTFVQLEQEYLSMIDNFWQIYMPVFENEGLVHTALSGYFTAGNQTSLSPLEKYDLSRALSQMMLRDSQVQWIALFSEEREQNYILFNNGTGLQPIPDDFPYLDRLTSGPGLMELYGALTLSGNSSSSVTFAVCGGVPAGMGNGKLLAGYSVSSLDQICTANPSLLESLNYTLWYNDEILFNSEGQYRPDSLFRPDGNRNGREQTECDGTLYVRSKVSGNNASVLSCTASFSEIFRYSHSNTPSILLVVMLFALLSILLYILMLRMISKEVDVIRSGLDEIGENNLEYRIPTSFQQSGLPEIAASINHMAMRLHENINRAYYYELRQKEAELSELQSKFNPHFLYNTLEMLRTKSYQNGDTKTAELIAQLAAIFRGFIGSRTFIPLSEELAFSKRYLSLFGARYGDRVKILYDIDSEILGYGIIRNVLQPLIENYFVHGFDASGGDNYILFRGESLDDHHMIITVEDNGIGMPDEEMEQLNLKLQEPVRIDTESYGLKNLHQRISLFYGEGCGLSIRKNGEKGLRLQMILRKMTCEEYETEQALHTRAHKPSPISEKA